MQKIPMAQKRGRPRKADVARRDKFYAPDATLLGAEDAFVKLVREKWKDLTGKTADKDLLKAFLGTSFNDTSRNQWLNNTFSRASSTAYPTALLKALKNKTIALPTADARHQTAVDGWALDNVFADTRAKLAEALSTYLHNIQSQTLATAASTARSAAERSATVAKQSTPTETANPFGALAGLMPSPSLAKAWRMLTAADFAKPNEGDVEQAIRDFLRGGQWTELWVARHGSFWRKDEVEALFKQADANPYVFVHGPLGQGKSMLLRQLAAHWIDQGRSVFLIKGEEAFEDSALLDAASASTRPLLILDDKPLTRPVSAGFAWDGGKAATIVQTLQTRELAAQRRYAKALRPVNYLVPSVTPDQAEAYVDLMLSSGAAASANRDKTLEYFRDGLSGPDSAGGLWTAAYQATRGEGLDQRINRLVDDFASRDDRSAFYALAAATFANVQLTYGDGFPDHMAFGFPAWRQIMIELVEALDLVDDVTKGTVAALKRLGSLLEREFLNQPELGGALDDQANPVLQFRSPALTHSLNRWIFGGRNPDTSRERLSRWPYFSAMAAAMVDRGMEAPSFLALMNTMWNAWRSHFRGYADRSGLEGHDVDRIAKIIHDHAFAQKPDPQTANRLNMLLGRIHFYSSHTPGLDEAQAATRIRDAKERIRAATTQGCHSDILVDAIEIMYREEFDLDELNGAIVTRSELLNRLINDPKARPNDKLRAPIIQFTEVCLAEPPDPLRSLHLLGPEVLNIFSRRPAFATTMRRFCDYVRQKSGWNEPTWALREQFLEGKIESDSVSSLSSLVTFLVKHHANTDTFKKSADTISEKIAAGTVGNDPTANAYLHIIWLIANEAICMAEHFSAEAINWFASYRDPMRHGDYCAIIRFFDEAPAMIQSRGAN